MNSQASEPVNSNVHSMKVDMEFFKRAHLDPLCIGELRSCPEDFQVEEVLGFQPSGEGEHIFLWLEKRGLTTNDVCELIANFAQCKSRDIGFCGLKDKHAVTRQWFSIYLPKRTADACAVMLDEWSGLSDGVTSTSATPSLTVLHVTRHQKKLRRGVHKFNRFRLQLRNIQLDKQQSIDVFNTQLEDRLNQLSHQGFPNYFGEQRFGIEGMNVSKAVSMFSGSRRITRSKRSIYLSAARSFLFNHLLSARVKENTWNTYLEGDYLSLEGSNSFFHLQAESSETEADIQARLATGDLHIAGPMFGEGFQEKHSKSGKVEMQILSIFPELIRGLLSSELKMARRPLRVLPKNLQIKLIDNTLSLAFDLPTGSFATALLRELLTYTDMSATIAK